MTFTPVHELQIVLAAVFLANWLLSYMVHSTVSIGVAHFAKRRLELSSGERVWLWRAALFGPVATATGSVLLGNIPHTHSAVGDWVANILAPQASVSAGVVVLGLLALAVAIGLFIIAQLKLAYDLGVRHPAADTDRAALARLINANLDGDTHLTVSSHIPAPAAIGWNEICLPSYFPTLARDERDALIAHELGHLRRHDPLWLAFAWLVARMFFFQPLNRIALKSLREACEYAADDDAVSRNVTPLALARALSTLATHVTAQPHATSAIGSPLYERIFRLLSNAPSAPPAARTKVALVLAASVMLLTALLPTPRMNAERASNTIPWLAPSPEQPNARMREVRTWLGLHNP